MRKLLPVCLVAVPLQAVALPADHLAVGGTTISYTTSECFGSCPAYTVTLEPDGRGIFVGRRYTAVVGERRFTATPQQAHAFVARLAPYRPARESLIEMGRPACGIAPTDGVTIDVRWRDPSTRASHLRLYLSCEKAGKRRIAALASASALLPIADMIGPPQTIR